MIIMNEKIAPVQLTPEELGKVGGGASDYSNACDNQINGNCVFCIHKKDGQVFYNNAWRDCIGCNLSFEPLGSINGYLLINGQPIPAPPPGKEKG